ncbi:hypothetical protein OUZ56_015951 [Daphnia magna]|uniref:Uncharacterized protein n=1 Tax=Daphnia magna TaxID=35525 RepID=A0ABR0AP83_9CRUS|nr:hypothetical protein OUZ56_015951 [Daphnia magna]
MVTSTNGFELNQREFKFDSSINPCQGFSLIFIQQVELHTQSQHVYSNSLGQIENEKTSPLIYKYIHTPTQRIAALLSAQRSHPDMAAFQIYRDLYTLQSAVQRQLSAVVLNLLFGLSATSFLMMEDVGNPS